MKLTHKLSILTILFTFLCLIFTNCKIFSDIEEKGDGGKPIGNKEPPAIPKEYWGYWIQMDTGDKFYIDGYSIREYNEKDVKNGTVVQYGIKDYKLDNTNKSVMMKDKTVFFKEGGENRNFSFKISSIEDLSRGISLGHQNIIGHRENQNNKGDKETVKITPEGNIEFNGAVSGDSQKIELEQDNKVNSTIIVTPSFNGENMGTIPIVQEGSFAFKTTFDITKDFTGYCTALNTYNVTVHLKNIGTSECKTSDYKIYTDNTSLLINNGENNNTVSNNFMVIDPGKEKTVSFTVQYLVQDLMNEEYIDIPIYIDIKTIDPKSDMTSNDVKYITWKDSITLRFYKGYVRFHLKAIPVESTNTDTPMVLNGFLIYPDGSSCHFTVPGNGEVEHIILPWSEKDYILAFSGATANDELKYTFCFPEKTELSDISKKFSIEEIYAYENNDFVSNAKTILCTESIKACLQKGDIDFYKLNTKELKNIYLVKQPSPQGN